MNVQCVVMKSCRLAHCKYSNSCREDVVIMWGLSLVLKEHLSLTVLCEKEGSSILIF